MKKTPYPNYYEKYLQYCGERSGTYQFIKFLEELNALDWRDLIADIGLESIWVKYMSAGNRDISTAGYYATFFKKLGTTPIRLLRTALEEYVCKYISTPRDKRAVKILKTVLEISFLLGFGINETVLTIIFITGEGVPEEIKKLAMKTIANYNESRNMDKI